MCGCCTNLVAFLNPGLTLSPMTQGKAPEGWEFHDTEEEYKVDASGNGQWHILAPLEREEPPEPVISQKSMKSPRGRGGGKKRRAAAA